MIIFTDNTACAERFMEGMDIAWRKILSPENEDISVLASRIFGNSDLFAGNISSGDGWNYLLIAKTAAESQYDILIELSRKNVALPHGTLCLAGEGRKFHGFKGRHWDSPEGNLYLSAYFAPQKKIEHYGPGFMVLAAVSVIDAVDAIPELSRRARIKWVNDIFIDDAKVCGVLAHTAAESEKVTNAVIGIGLNVETEPLTEPTIFVPGAAALNEFASGQNFYTRGLLFDLLKKTIYKNYLTLIDGDFYKLLNRYRECSNIIGRDVIIYNDSQDDIPAKIGEGRVISIGNNLELFIEGFEKPVKRGRLALK